MTLTVIGGPASGQSHTSPAPATITIGQAATADFQLADTALSPRHCSIEFTRLGTLIRDLDSLAGVSVNGSPTLECGLYDRDQITIGQSVLDVQIGIPAPPVVEAPEEEPAPPPPTFETARELIDARELADDFDEELLEESQNCSPREMLELLTERELTGPALLLAAHILDRVPAAEWAVSTVRDLVGDSLKPADTSALEAAENWLADPTEDNRLAAGKAALALNYKGPAAFAAQSIFWIEGSITPPDTPDPPPNPAPPNLHRRGVVGAILSALASGPSETMKARATDCLQQVHSRLKDA